MEKELYKYIKDKHTTEECAGFIDGFKAAEKCFKQGVVAGTTFGAIIGTIITIIIVFILLK